MQHVIMRMESHLVSYGTETIDNLGATSRFPQASMLTGLLANAMGWRWDQKNRHQDLQDRLVFAARIDRDPQGGVPLTDYQTVRMSRKDQTWTTRGVPAGRDGGDYQGQIRLREFLEDTRVTVALRLEPGPAGPSPEQISQALRKPARPLFIGRGSNIPSEPIFQELRDAESTVAALLEIPLDRENAPERVLLYWAPGEEAGPEVRVDRSAHSVTDERDWRSGLHGGSRAVVLGSAPRESFPNETEEWTE